ncbi:MAG: polysaccharide biosynthesis/export family protein [Candidatus Symbiothrix sp.]|nr:polysaccharide biosynthesis/export family protein [Candidatus Symbiothrix sp.]
MHKLRIITYCVAALFVGSMLVSCGSKKKIVYFQGAEKKIGTMEDLSKYDVKIKPHDNLMIMVSTANNPAAAVPYNTIDLSRGSLYGNILDLLGYLVDEQGYINFPQVGKLYVVGMTKSELSQLLISRLKEYLDASSLTVNVRFLNFQISVLGEVNRPGDYVISDESVTLPQIIAQAGDLTIYGQRKNIKVFRTLDSGEKKCFVVDLTKPDVFYSEAYYLHQNDVIYVEPNSARTMGASYNPMISTYLSVAGLLVSISTLVISILNSSK